MTRQPASASQSARRRALCILVLLVAWPLLVALWVAAGLGFGAPAAWMAVVVVADASLLLGLLRWPPGPSRVAAALVFLLACSLPALWAIAAGIVAPAFALWPWESALRMGPTLFHVLSEPWWTMPTVLWFAAAAALAAWWNR